MARAGQLLVVLSFQLLKQQHLESCLNSLYLSYLVQNLSKNSFASLWSISILGPLSSSLHPSTASHLDNCSSFNLVSQLPPPYPNNTAALTLHKTLWCSHVTESKIKSSYKGLQSPIWLVSYPTTLSSLSCSHVLSTLQLQGLCWHCDPTLYLYSLAFTWLVPWENNQDGIR